MAYLWSIQQIVFNVRYAYMYSEKYISFHFIVYPCHRLFYIFLPVVTEVKFENGSLNLDQAETCSFFC